MILDTAFIIDVMENDEKAVRRAKELKARGEPQAIATPSLFELYSGVGRSTKPETEKRKILHTLSRLLVWPLDPESAERGGEIDGKLISEGQKIDPLDSMIAGIALSKGQTILTRNVSHFNRIPGLSVETY